MVGFCIVVGWFFGLVVANSVVLARAGLNPWGTFRQIRGTKSRAQFLSTLIPKTFFWPFALVIWLLRGQPLPRWMTTERHEELVQEGRLPA